MVRSSVCIGRGVSLQLAVQSDRGDDRPYSLQSAQGTVQSVPTRRVYPRLVITANSIVAEKSNAERYCTHFSAFDLSAKPGFFFIRVSLVSKPLGRGDAKIAWAEDSIGSEIFDISNSFRAGPVLPFDFIDVKTGRIGFR